MKVTVSIVVCCVALLVGGALEAWAQSARSVRSNTRRLNRMSTAPLSASQLRSATNVVRMGSSSLGARKATPRGNRKVVSPGSLNRESKPAKQTVTSGSLATRTAGSRKVKSFYGSAAASLDNVTTASEKSRTELSRERRVRRVGATLDQP